MLAKSPLLLNRELVCRELRSGNHKQQRGSLGNFSDPTAPVCFQGVVYRTLGKPNFSSISERLTWWRENLGIDVALGALLVTKNDNNYNFAELADQLEELPLT